MSTKLTISEIKARVRPVCICKGIKMGKICDAIVSGCLTVKDVNQKTGSGSGGCGATRCTPVILKLIDNKGVPLTSSEFSPPQNDQE
jgi:NAD(P)H-nitrite reductase large subunit